MSETGRKTVSRRDPRGHDLSMTTAERERVEVATGAQVAKKDRVLHRRTLGEERAYNPFLRVDDLRFRDGLKAAHPAVYAAELARSKSPDEAAFRTLRTLRNDW